jgi:uncharacterized protein involved in response to NO
MHDFWPHNRGWALFEAGFRPFFLLAGLDGLANMILWLAAYFHPHIWPADAIPAMYWHAHEMLFGFAGAAIAGFLLTAVPNWTGRVPYRGPVLWLLTGLWIGGRIVMLPVFAQSSLGLVISLSFFPALALTVAPALLRARKYRNLPFLVLLLLLFSADLFFQKGFGGAPELGQHIGLYAALDIIMVMIVIIGGRIVPNFTHNSLVKWGVPTAVASRTWLERGAILSLLLMVVLDMSMPLSTASGMATLVAAIFQAMRFSQWQGHYTLRDPLLWVLHLGYAWLVVALALKAGTLLAGAVIAERWLHAFTVGGIGTMILAVMSRAALGHSGRPLVAPQPMAISYLLLSLAAIIRVFGPAVFPSRYDQIVGISGALWILAFAIYLWIYAPILLTPRRDGKPG